MSEKEEKIRVVVPVCALGLRVEPIMFDPVLCLGHLLVFLFLFLEPLRGMGGGFVNSSD